MDDREVCQASSSPCNPVASYRAMDQSRKDQACSHMRELQYSHCSNLLDLLTDSSGDGNRVIPLSKGDVILDFWLRPRNSMPNSGISSRPLLLRRESTKPRKRDGVISVHLSAALRPVGSIVFLSALKAGTIPARPFIEQHKKSNKPTRGRNENRPPDTYELESPDLLDRPFSQLLNFPVHPNLITAEPT